MSRAGIESSSYHKLASNQLSERHCSRLEMSKLQGQNNKLIKHYLAAIPLSKSISRWTQISTALNFTSSPWLSDQWSKCQATNHWVMQNRTSFRSRGWHFKAGTPFSKKHESTSIQIRDQKFDATPIFVLKRHCIQSIINKFSDNKLASTQFSN